jgi:protein O-GlcNAc transferase
VSACATARAALAAYVEEPALADSVAQAVRAVRGVAELLAPLSDREFQGTLLAAGRELLAAVGGSGLHDAPVADDDLAFARTAAKRGGAGLFAAMVCVPAWQWPDAPSIARIPAALAGDYVAWFLAPPQGFSAPGQAGLYPERHLARLEDLLRFAQTQAGSPAVREALLTLLKRGNCIPLYFCADSLRRHYEVRARLLSCAVVRPAVDRPARPRAGRRLRVGFINRHFGPQTETYTTLPMFEQLDPERFEVLLFAHHAGGTPLEEHARGHAAGFTLLPADAGAQVDALRAAELDVAVFGTNVTAVFHEVTRLALHRVAPLQAVNNSSCATTGLPEIDLYVSGTLTEAPDAPAHFSERLGLVAGPAHAFNYEADRQEPTSTWTRAMLGLPDDAVVFVTAANFFKIIPEMQHAWAKLLAAVPGSRLLVHPFNPNWSSSYPIKRFAAEFDRVLEAHGVATDRLVISSVKFPSRTDVKELLRVGDIYLDTFPFGGVNSLVDPLELGLPAIVWEGGTFRARMGGALLRSLGLDELIATDEAGYLALATRLAAVPEARAALKARIAEAMGRAPVFLDSLAASDAFGALLETAYDELAATGRAAFRANRTPVRAAVPAEPMTLVRDGVACLEADDLEGAAAAARAVLGAYPAQPAARHLLGAVHLRAGRAVRAVDYLLGAVQQADGDAPLWHDLAIALCESGRAAQALQALETSLRLDGRRLDGWLLFAELARNAGNAGLAAQALDVARELAPDDPRVRATSAAPAPKASPVQLARACLQRHDWAGAEQQARAALAAEPQSAAAHHALGLALLRLEKPADAIRELDRAAQLDPRQADYWQSLGGVLLQFAAHAKAAVVLENAVRLKPDAADSWALLGEARLHGKDIAGAEEALQRALRLRPDHAHALLWFGHVRKRQGRLAEALQLHRRSVGAPVPAPAAGRTRRRVVFVAQHGPMWTSLKSVYEAFAADPAWEAVIVAVPYLGTWGEGEQDKTLAVLGFLAKEGLPFVRWDEFPLEPGCADLLFLPKPHDHTRPPEWQALSLLKYVPRLAYVPYALEIGGSDLTALVQWNLPLQQVAWMVFARSARQKSYYANHCISGDAHVVVTGHPKMDAMRQLATVHDADLDRFIAGRKMVLWNAQYDVIPDGSPWGQGYSTFMRWWKFLPEEFARRPGLALVLRPHPIFFSILKLRKILTDDELNGFFARCEAAGNIAIDRRTSYLPVFAASQAMISDASSFVLEYAATGKPLLYLHNPHGPGLTSDGDFVFNDCYAAQTEAEIARFLDQVEAGEDPRAAQRRQHYPEFMTLPADGVGVTIKRLIDERIEAEEPKTVTAVQPALAAPLATAAGEPPEDEYDRLHAADRLRLAGGLWPFVHAALRGQATDPQLKVVLLLTAFAAAAEPDVASAPPDESAGPTVLMAYLPWFDFFDHARLVGQAHEQGVKLVLCTGLRARRRRVLAGVDAGNLRTYVYRGFTVWSLCSFTIAFEVGVMPEEVDFAQAAHREVIQRKFGYAASVVDEALDFFACYRPQTVIVARGYDVLATVLRLLAVQRGIRVAAFENSFHRDRMVWDDVSGVSVNRNLARNYFWRYEESVPAETAARTVADYFTAIKSLKSAEHQSPAATGSAWNADVAKTERTILFLGQVGIDSSVFFGRQGFASQGEIVRTLAEHAVAAGCRLIVKLHPKESSTFVSSWPGYRRCTIDRLERDPGFCAARARLGARLLVDAENEHDTYALIRQADVCVTLNSQAGLEALVLDKEVVVCGNAFYGALGFTHEAPDAPLLRFTLDRVLREGARRNDGHRARRFFHIFTELYCLPKNEQGLLTLMKGPPPFSPADPR